MKHDDLEDRKRHLKNWIVLLLAICFLFAAIFLFAKDLLKTSDFHFWKIALVDSSIVIKSWPIFLTWNA